jgi:hypothetical protein
VAINPTSPDHVIAVLMQAGTPGEPRVSHAYVSANGGLTWTARAAANGDGRVQGDDAAAFFGDYNGIDAYGGRVMAAFPVQGGPGAARGDQRVLAAVARFEPATQQLR